MKDTTRPFPPPLRAACITFAVFLAVLVPMVAATSATAAEAPKPAPQLSIAVDDGRASTAAGDTLKSVITVRNLGTDDVVGLKITQSMSTGVTFGSADAAGIAKDGAIDWTVNVRAGGEAVLHSTMTVSPTAPELLRLATVACARSSTDTPPIVCASDSDQLPAGALAERPTATPDDTVWWILAGGVGLLGVAVVVTVLMRRRRTRRPTRTSIDAAMLIVIMVGTGASTAPVGVGVGATPAAQIEQAPALADPIRLVSADSAAPLVKPTVAATPAELRAAPFTTALPSGRAGVAVATAMAQIGLPYVWGGNGLSAGDAGFDCSGLTTFSYAVAGTQLPRTAQTQFFAGPHLITGTLLEPGDLVFYGTLARVHHVGMYIGQGRMVNAPTFGMLVQTAYYRWSGDDYLGATRPAAIGQPVTGFLTYTPPIREPGVANPSSSPIFLAPKAPLPVVAAPATTTPLHAGLSAAETRSPDVGGQAPTPAVDPAPSASSSAGPAAAAANVPDTDQPTTAPAATTRQAAASPTPAARTAAPTTTAPTTTATGVPTTAPKTTTPKTTTPKTPPPTRTSVVAPTARRAVIR